MLFHLQNLGWKDADREALRAAPPAPATGAAPAKAGAAAITSHQAALQQLESHLLQLLHISKENCVAGRSVRKPTKEIGQLPK